MKGVSKKARPSINNGESPSRKATSIKTTSRDVTRFVAVEVWVSVEVIMVDKVEVSVIAKA